MTEVVSLEGTNIVRVELFPKAGRIHFFTEDDKEVIVGWCEAFHEAIGNAMIAGQFKFEKGHE